MDITFADLCAVEVELLPSREALAFFNLGANINISRAVAAQVLAAASANTALANPVQALVQS
jgi:hypothetical protein